LVGGVGDTALCATDGAIRPLVAALAAATLTAPKEACVRFHTMGGRVREDTDSEPTNV
jgi:hypothetical protein